MPPGGEGLTGELKKTLKELGWQLAVDRGPSVVEGILGDQTKLESFNTFNTRYRLSVASSQYDTCILFLARPLMSSPAITYDISFVDNSTGAEVFTLAGNGCQPHVVNKFKRALLEN